MFRDRRWVFAAATLGYGIYYVCRLSLSAAKSGLVDSGVLSPAQLGWIGSALFWSYAVGKFANGFLADRVDLRRFASIGLLGTAAVNLAIGLKVGFWLFLVLWLANGWLQSMGAPAFVVSLVRMFRQHERGSYYGIWSVSHHLGEATSFAVTAALVAHFGWRAGFFGAAGIGLGGAALLWIFFQPPARQEPMVAKASTGREQRAVLAMPVVWEIALASALMYVARYAINSWGVFYLEKAKGLSVVEASLAISVSSAAGIVGTVSSGWLSDRCFAGDRCRPALIMGMASTVSLLTLLLAPPHQYGVYVGTLVVFGSGIGALVCYLGGLMAVDLVPTAAAGAALGMVGIASYLGAAVQDIASGYLIQSQIVGANPQGLLDLRAVAACWVAAIALSTVVIWRISRRARAVRA
ncbi:MFS transporter [Opitutaceae bacterium EW11]|nr:MFS transporter [Opitutaceae bacterium EW11]